MNKKEIISCLEYLGQERGIDRVSMAALLEEAMVSAGRKAPRCTREFAVKVDPKTGEIKCTAKLFVAEYVSEPCDEISLVEARKRNPDVKAGDEILWDIDPVDMGRIVSQATKQLFNQKMSISEKKNVCEIFREQLNQLVTGEVCRLDREGIIVKFPTMSTVPGAASMSEGLLRREDKIPGENFEIGDLVTALLVEINSDRPGPALIVSRSAPEFVTRLFEREVTEINDGLVQIKSIAREAGYRCKVAVASTESRIDPTGACVGQRGIRVRTIVRELSGEKVDIIEWSDDVKTYVTNALKPAVIQNMKVNEEKKSVLVEVPEDQLSLSIGKKGQNARLASLLTGWKIDIVRGAKQQEENENDFDTLMRKAIEKIGSVEGIGMEAAETLVKNGFASLEGISAPVVELDDIAKLPGFDRERAAAVIEAAKAALEQ